jgi:hypothetical protein
MDTHLACNKLSLISTSVAPFLTAPLTCVPSSTHFPNAVNITRFKRLLSLNDNPGRVQIVPQALSYMSSGFRHFKVERKEIREGVKRK